MPPHPAPRTAQVRWNFLRSQSIDQLEADEVDPEKSDAATLDFNELQATVYMHVHVHVHVHMHTMCPCTTYAWA